VHFKPKLVRREKENHFIPIKGEIHQVEITINLYVPNVSAPTSLNIHIGLKNTDES
jgi:hypothetical protein